ncbi:ParB/RepB/Spo0J family partition protein [Candidatus Puniceispirillum marinum]|uniref:ParB-like partition protein n=1 Tax=Puniceispirillum marinum (strain IMCC1322) TaxID=488538 RepID=D5BUE5_PUNMI|nr:ParB/RepB/Spo0J family partition protein [Candidatus Puniceispirillum marinum]ADE39892.1 parB-like partition protein [Candidatus Puniceispirillum marinum IMCC1322]
MAKTPSKKAPAKQAATKTSSPEKVIPKHPARGLGRGLSSLLGDAGIAAATTNANPNTASGVATPPEMATSPLSADAKATKAGIASGVTGNITAGVIDIPVEWINSGPWQPRLKFDKTALAELAESIRQKGIMQPVLVRQSADNPQRYQLIAGERRWRAAQLAQLHTVPAILRDISDVEAYELALIENVQRTDLTVIEEALGYQNLISKHKYKQEQLSELIGKSRSHIANLLRLLSLPSDVMTMVADGQLTMGQVRPLIGHEDASALAEEIISKNLSARQVEALVKRRGETDTTSGQDDHGKAGSTASEKSTDILALEARAAEQLGLAMTVDWDASKASGKLVFHCEDFAQITFILEQLGLE